MSAPLVFDLETVPLASSMSAPYPEADRPAPSNYKDAEKIAAWHERDREKWAAERAKECALNPRLGRIVCVGYSHGSGGKIETQVAMTEADERGVLLLLWENIAYVSGQFVTFNGLTFDVPFFLTRSLIHGITPTVSIRTVRDWTRRYSFGPHYDLRGVLTAWDARASGTLTDWATALGIPNDDSVKGADVWTLYQNGDFASIAAHAEKDVATTAALYDRVSQMYGGVA